jgi:alkyl hydroperoxide reductase subunit AhpC
MSLRINTIAPDFIADSTQGKISFHSWIGNSWAILFSHPKDFTPVCTTELGYMAKLESEFNKRDCKLIGLSTNSVSNHDSWAMDIEETQGYKVTYPIIADTSLVVSKLYNMLPAERVDLNDINIESLATIRAVFIIDPDKKIRLMMTYPMSVGRNFDEILRVLDAIQLCDRHQVATPAHWQYGDDVIISLAVSDTAAREKYPKGWKTLKPYLRLVNHPD